EKMVRLSTSHLVPGALRGAGSTPRCRRTRPAGWAGNPVKTSRKKAEGLPSGVRTALSIATFGYIRARSIRWFGGKITRSTARKSFTGQLHRSRGQTLTAYTVPFEKLGRHDVDTVGGKNSSLGEMISHLANMGVSVPTGFATTAEAYRDF